MIDDSPPATRSAPLWLPDAPHAARLAVTATIVWIAVRLGSIAVHLSIAARLGLTARQVVALHPVAALTVVLLAAAAVMLEQRRRRETLFYANVGVPAAWAGIVSAAVAGVLEVAVWLVVGSGG